MANRYKQTVLTPSVLATQEHYYGRSSSVSISADRDPLTDEELTFITARDSFYMATISENGWPYIQHRGGSAGFLRVLDAHTLAFGDFGGNRQLLSTGNLAVNDRVALFLMDYPRQERLKILGHARVLDAREHSDLAQRVHPPEFAHAKPERIYVVDVLSFDWNCPKFITPRFTEKEVEAATHSLRDRIRALEQLLGERS
jgi:predicted pyridoxine 5'-phosphate oxidase superfamily flavin-nucleotide-binding protein